MRKLRGQEILAFCMLVFGFFLSVQIKSFNPNFTFVTLRSIKELENEIKAKKIDLENTNELILQKRAEVEKYKLEIEKTGSVDNLIEKEKKNLKVISGLQDIQGPGIVVELKDSDKDLEEWQSANNLLVHDIDVLNVINDLKIAGAEAISINGERLISTSEIKCAGATITVNDTTYGQPFVIKAIGDKKLLDASIKSPLAMTYILKEVRGIDVKTSTSDKIQILGYKYPIKFKYIKEVIR